MAFAAAEGFALRPDPVALLAFIWQMGVLSIASYGLMWAILNRSDAMRTSALMPLVPPVMLAMSARFLAEPIGPVKLLRLILATVGGAVMRARAVAKAVGVAD